MIKHLKNALKRTLTALTNITAITVIVTSATLLGFDLGTLQDDYSWVPQLADFTLCVNLGNGLTMTTACCCDKRCQRLKRSPVIKFFTLLCKRLQPLRWLAFVMMRLVLGMD